MAQAIVESGWGQSRFALEGNALYGQWTTNEQKGIIPEDRDEDKTHAVRKFENLKQSVHSSSQSSLLMFCSQEVLKHS